MARKFMITSALPYANGGLHLGHLAGAYLPADIYVRYLRAMGEDVLWVSGSDEHGAAITMRAKKDNIEPKKIIDKYHNLNKTSFKKLKIDFDIFHRTSEAIHHETSQDFFKVLNAKGDDFEVIESEQYYDEEYDQFLADRYISGTCPKCNHPKAFGDQCENCGSDLSPLELINPVSKLSGKNPILRKTKHWYFRLNKYEDWLRIFIENGANESTQHHDPSTWKNHVKGQCMSWVNQGLQPRSITRDLNWGIKVPVEGGEGKVLYVWFDAPIGYISATKQWAIDNGKDWKEYWQNPERELIHFIGKDNIVFHCIVFPSMLKAHGDFVLPKNVPANQFLNFEDEKFSKSRGWGITLEEYLEEFAAFDGAVDALRYVIARIMPENRDANFKWDEFIDFYDNELVNNLGNFINRTIVLTHKYFEGKVPICTTERGESYEKLQTLLDRWQAEIEGFTFKAAAMTMMEISSLGNTYLQDISPWILYKTEPESEVVKTCMQFCLDIVEVLSVITKPMLPDTSDKIRNLIGKNPVQNGDLKIMVETIDKDQSLVEAGRQLSTPTLLFAKINDRKDATRLDIVNKQKNKLTEILETEAANTVNHPPLQSTIQFDDFTKLDIRTGTITAAEKVKKADKLLKIEVDLGFETRTVLSGIAKFYEPEAIVGQQVLVLANLAPRKMRGIESNGMILMAEDADGKLSFVSAEKDWVNGFPVK